jgi:hypothetical protein
MQLSAAPLQLFEVLVNLNSPAKLRYLAAYSL